jgi:hypothetical protein
MLAMPEMLRRTEMQKPDVYPYVPTLGFISHSHTPIAPSPSYINSPSDCCTKAALHPQQSARKPGLWGPGSGS